MLRATINKIVRKALLIKMLMAIVQNTQQIQMIIIKRINKLIKNFKRKFTRSSIMANKRMTRVKNFGKLQSKNQRRCSIVKKREKHL